VIVPLHELHPFTDAEVANLPSKRGVYVLFQVQIPLHADGAVNLRKSLLAAKAKFPGATHFSVEALGPSAGSVAQRLRALRKELRRVRAAAFIGTSG
jgi:hypothetical protein